jgi:hypothetical protein
MRVLGARMSDWRVRGMWVGGAVFAITLGACVAERPVPVEGETPLTAAPAPVPRSAGVVPAPATTMAATAPLRVKMILPPPVAMPGGGTRIDMRGSGKHTRALERQPDGTFKHVCVDAPEMGRPSR